MMDDLFGRWWMSAGRSEWTVIVAVALVLLVLLLVLVWLRRRWVARGQRRAGEEAQYAGRLQATRRFAKEMNLSVPAFLQLVAWADHQRHEAKEIWPYITTLTTPQDGRVRMGTLSDVRKQHPDPKAAIRAIYFGVQATRDDQFRLQWEQLIERVGR